jgi:hypothetical protein
VSLIVITRDDTPLPAPAGRRLQSIGHQCPIEPKSPGIRSSQHRQTSSYPCKSEQSALLGRRLEIPLIALHTRELSPLRAAKPALGL